MNEQSPNSPLTWDDSFTIAQLLRERHASHRVEDVSLMMIYRWTLQLPEFQDDPQIADEIILAAILKEWFEEANSL